jgi:hypothetical protein
MIDLPGYISPELPAWCAALTRPIREAVHTDGTIAAWLDPHALEDRPRGGGATGGGFEPLPADLMLLILCDVYTVRSEAITAKGISLTVTRMEPAALREALEWDDELAALIVRGYRLCGCEPSANEIEALAHQVVETR